MKKFLKISITIFLIFCKTNSVISEIPEKIQDAYNDFKKDVEQINTKINQLDIPKDEKLKVIDESLRQINEITSVVNQAYESQSFDLIQSNLNFLSTVVNKTSTLIPNQYENDLSKVDLTKMDSNDAKTISNVSSSMKSKRAEKQATLVEDMLTLEKNGVDAFKINSELGKKGITIISVNEISQVVEKNKTDVNFKNDVIAELKKNDAPEGEINQIENGAVLASLPGAGGNLESSSVREDGKGGQGYMMTPRVDPYNPDEETADQITLAKTLASFGISDVNERQSKGIPYDEFSKIQNNLYSQIKAAGFNDEQTEQVIFNLKTKYADVWFHAKEVYEGILTNGGTIEDAQKAQQDWLNAGDNGLGNWISIFGKNQNLTNDQKYSLTDYLNELNPDDIPLELASDDRILKEAQARVVSYFTIDDPNGERITSGKIIDEATAISDKVKEAAMKYGLSEERANILASNAATYYLDVWYEGTLVSEAQLAKGFSWEGKNGADKAVEDWWNNLPEDSPFKQFDSKLYNPAAPDFDNDLDYIPDDEALQNWFASLTDEDFIKLEPSEKRIYAEGVARTLSYLKFDEKGNITGDIINEAQQVQNAIIEAAAKAGYDSKASETIAKNAAIRYFDIWFNATIVSESELAKGKSWEDADKAVDKWAETSEFGEWIDLLYGDNERFVADEQFFLKLAFYFQSIGFREIYDTGLPITRRDESWDPNETIEQNRNRKMDMGEIKDNKELSNVMNSMSDEQVSALIASGVINDQLLKQYTMNGKNAPIGNLDFNLQEANRQMQISSIGSNELLSKVLNSLSDRQAYELIASGVIPTELVREYIKDGLNAPVQPCGSNTCDMIEFTKSGRRVEPGQLALEQQALTQISKDLIGTGNFEGLSAADALGDGLAEAVAEIQASLNEGAVIRGADGQTISVQEALESMPEGGQVNPDGTLEPVAPGAAEDPGCGGTC